MYSDELLQPWLRALRDEIGDVRPFDVHTHTGQNDPDGFRGSREQLLDALDAAGGASAAVFSQQEPAGYPPANDRVLAEAAASGGRLVPFCRIDPRADGAGEVERCLERGARGVKLHPRAERFRLDVPAVHDVLRVADALRMPVLIHAGRGIPALGRDTLALSERFPGARLILAHCGISDLAWLWRYADQHPNVYFDTAWWAPADVLGLLALVPPGQVLFGSDAPYGTTVTGAIATGRYALQAGLSAEQVRAVLGDQARRLVAWEDPLELGPAPGPGAIGRDLLLDRVETFLVAAITRMFQSASPDEQIALARLACDVGDDAPQAAVCRSVLALLDRRSAEPRPDEAGMPFSPGAHLVIVALAVARTPDVRLPALASDV